jgi:hypothetical protein
VEKLRELTDTHAFRVGLATGVAIAVALVVIGMVVRFSPLRRLFPRLPGLAGLAFAAAAAVVLGVLDEVDAPGDGDRGFRLGLIVLAAGGLVSGLRPRLWTGALAAVPGAWLLADAGLRDTAPNVRPVVALTVVAACPLVAAFERRSPIPGLGCALLAVTAFGQYITVPDTEKAQVLVGLAAPIGLVGWPLRLVGLGRAGSYAAVGALSWAAATGGAARSGSIVGAGACLGVLVAAPVGWELRSRWARSSSSNVGVGADPPGLSGAPEARGAVATMRRRWLALLVICHGLLVVWGARVAGLRDELSSAAMLAAPVLILGAVVVSMAVPTGESGSSEQRTP